MPDNDQTSVLSVWEIRVLRGVIEVGFDDRAHYAYNDELRSIGWITSGRLSAHLRSESFITRKSLRRLADSGYLDRAYRDEVEYFRINAVGRAALTPPDELEAPSAFSLTKFGLVNDEQVTKIIRILSQIEDLSESTQDNLQRSQISGLVRSLNILIQLPQVPKEGILALLRDPAFANIVQLGTFWRRLSLR
ncbi:hypothetical protein PIB19_03800 [Sphingomonas sp. 7/4-4]|uniref:hypothetical protein n=1 Tax=Sphingomonas sp. 7/4-4 TaxID=3018446 RepID=UPI0022F3DB14|nr:hypothetical protein [Sphingomonas sp. 7/4-4]WBY08603.1 hypothetical protein PIB19_03800 [Sphingomonas sp. 7/4-4]